MEKADLETPALLIDRDALDSNIRLMADYLKDKPVKLRPHTKCHKTPIIAHMQVRAGARGILVAKLGEAEVMANAGVEDIAIGNQVVQKSKIERLINLNRDSSVSVAVDNPEIVDVLSKTASRKGVEVKVIVELDVGQNRAGVPPGKPALDLAKKVSSSEGLIFNGLMGWEGHLAGIQSFDERRSKSEECYRKVVMTKEMIECAGLEVETVSAGGTTTYNMAAEYPGITEIEAGSYIFMDASHRVEGVPFKNSLTVLATVTSIPTPDRVIIDGGLKTFSYVGGLPQVKGIEGVEVYDLSEEHGHLKLKDPGIELKVGDMIELIPAYAPTTVNLHNKFYVTKGETVEAVWKIEGRGRID